MFNNIFRTQHLTLTDLAENSILRQKKQKTKKACGGQLPTHFSRPSGQVESCYMAQIKEQDKLFHLASSSALYDISKYKINTQTKKYQNAFSLFERL